MIRPVVALVALLASSIACAGGKTRDCGDPMSSQRTLSDGRAASRATVGSIPGYELLVPVAGPGEPPEGLVCRVSDRVELRGLDAWRAGTAATSDPYQLAVLAMLVLERGVAGRDPWVAGQPGPPEAQAPSLSAGELVYWRRHQQLANWVRVTVEVQSGAVQAALDTELAKPAGSLVDQARAALSAPTLPARIGAVGKLAASDEDGARALLFEAASGNDAWKVRQEAVRQLGERPRSGAIEVLVEVLGSDPQAEVRAAAATAIGKLGDPTGLPAVMSASTDDPSPAVKAAASGAVARLK